MAPALLLARRAFSFFFADDDVRNVVVTEVGIFLDHTVIVFGVDNRVVIGSRILDLDDVGLGILVLPGLLLPGLVRFFRGCFRGPRGRGYRRPTAARSEHCQRVEYRLTTGADDRIAVKIVKALPAFAAGPLQSPLQLRHLVLHRFRNAGAIATNAALCQSQVALVGRDGIARKRAVC